MKNTEKILKTAREKKLITYEGNFIRLSADFSAETLQARESGMIYLKCWNKNLPTKNTLPGIVVLQKWSRDKDFPRQTKAEEAHDHWTYLTRDAERSSSRLERMLINMKTCENMKHTGKGKYTVKFDNAQ